jgi:hypothetical protein
MDVGVNVGAGVSVGMGVFVGGKVVAVGVCVGNGVGVGGIAGVPQPTSNTVNTTSQTKRVIIVFCIFPPLQKQLGEAINEVHSPYGDKPSGWKQG